MAVLQARNVQTLDHDAPVKLLDDYFDSLRGDTPHHRWTLPEALAANALQRSIQRLTDYFGVPKRY